MIEGICTGIKTTVIHPATEKHISKYSCQNSYMVDETPEVYRDLVLPHITTDQFDLKVNYVEKLSSLISVINFSLNCCLN